MQVTATQAKSRFGALCAQAKTESVFVEKRGRIDSVILSAQQCSESQVANLAETLAQCKVHFEREHSIWLAEQNQRVESQRLWCDDLRVR